MSDSARDLICTNADLWLATQPDKPGERGSFATILKTPMSVLGVRNASALSRAVESAVSDINTARVALCEQFGTKSDDGANYTITDVPAWTAGWSTLMAEAVTLAGVRALTLSECVPGAFLAPEDVRRCGALLSD